MTPAQAEIVRRFMAGESQYDLWHRDHRLVPGKIEPALRAALAEKDARIVELNSEANRLSTEIGKQDAEIERLKASTRISIRDAQIYKREESP